MDAKSPETVAHITEFAETLSALETVVCDSDSDIRDSAFGFTIDFTIGSADEYRVWDGNREHRAIHRSSIHIGASDDAPLLHPKHVDKEYLVVEELSVHLPLYQADENEWKEYIDESYRFSLSENSGGLSTATHYPSPHIELTADACSLAEAEHLVREAAGSYQETKDAILANRSDTRTGLDAGRARRESEE